MKIGKPSEFFDSIAAKTRHGRDLATWRGELYFELHRGVGVSIVIALKIWADELAHVRRLTPAKLISNAATDSWKRRFVILSIMELLPRYTTPATDIPSKGRVSDLLGIYLIVCNLGFIKGRARCRMEGYNVRAVPRRFTWHQYS